jgi:hypothetical protein
LVLHGEKQASKGKTEAHAFGQGKAILSIGIILSITSSVILAKAGIHNDDDIKIETNVYSEIALKML